MLYAFCREYGVPHRRCGKLLVATSEGEVEKLAAIKAQAEANGVTDLAWLDRDEAHALEPGLSVTKALLSPSTGIIDSHAFMLALLGDAERRGAVLALETPAVASRRGGRTDHRDRRTKSNLDRRECGGQFGGPWRAGGGAFNRPDAAR